MTDNIQKLYEVAGIEKEPIYSGSRLYNPVITGYDYPPFTAEKQLELIKWLGKRKDFALSCYNQIWEAETDFCWEYYETSSKHEHFDQALAGLILQLWDGLSSEHREEVRGILQ